MKLATTSENSPKIKNLLSFRDKFLNHFVKDKGLEIYDKAIKYWALLCLQKVLESKEVEEGIRNKEKNYFLHVLMKMDVILEQDPSKYDNDSILRKTKSEIKNIVTRDVKLVSWNWLNKKIISKALPFFDNLVLNSEIRIDISDLELSKDEIIDINSITNFEVEIEKKKFKKNEAFLKIRNIRNLKPEDYNNLPERIQSKINGYKSTMDEYFHFEKFNEIFNSIEKKDIEFKGVNGSIKTKAVKNPRAIFISYLVLGLIALITIGVLAALQIIAYSNLIVVAVSLTLMFLILKASDIKTQMTLHEFRKKVKEEEGKFTKWKEVLQTDDYKYKVLSKECRDLLVKELKDNGLDKSLAGKFLYGFKSSGEANIEKENDALRTLGSAYPLIKKLSTKTQMEFIDNIIAELGRNNYWYDNDIYKVVSSFGFSPVCAIGQRVMILARLHNAFIITGRAKNPISSMLENITNLNFLPEVKVVSDYMSSLDNIDRSLNIKSIVEKSMLAKEPNHYLEISRDIERVLGIGMYLPKDIIDDLKLLIRAYKEGEVEKVKLDRFVLLLDKGKQFNSKYHKHQDVKDILDGKNADSVRPRKEIEKYLAFNQAYQYFCNAGKPKIAKKMLEKNKSIIWNKIEDIVAKIENNTQIKINKKNCAVEEATIEKSNYSNEKAKLHILENYQKSFPLPTYDDSLNYNDSSDDQMKRYFQNNKYAKHWGFWLVTCIVGALLFIPAAFSVATIGFILAGSALVLFSALKLGQAQVSYKNIAVASEKLSAAKKEAIDLIINPVENGVNDHNIGVDL